MIQTLSAVMAAAAVCWFVSDVVELKAGGHTRLNLRLTIAYHLLAVVGIWGLHLAQVEDGPRTMSLLGTALLSIGYLVLTLVPVLILRGKADTPASAMAAHPILKAFGALSLLGILLFGAAAFQIGYYPAWTPIVFVVGSLVTLGVIATGRSMTIAILANFAVSLALFAMSWQVVV